MYLPEATLEKVLEAKAQLHLGQKDCLMLLFGEKTDIDLPALFEVLNTQGILFFGGIFPGIISGDERHEQGVILKKFKCAYPPTLVKQLKPEMLKELDAIDLPKREKKRTAIIFLDGLTSGINYFLEQINNRLGDKVNFIGAGAGSLSLVQQPSVFCNEGFFQDAAICCIIEDEIVLGVRHGWEHLAGPLVATRTDGNVIFELNWENAFEVYKNTIESDCNGVIEPANFLDVAKGYPLGILREGAEDIVRDPISVGSQGELICVGEVPSNTVLHILKGNADNLITSAKNAYEDCRQQLGVDSSPRHTLIVDCISRTLFLEEDFSRELQAIQTQIPGSEEESFAQGVLSLGEISSYGSGTLEFFNKTVVIGLVKGQQV